MKIKQKYLALAIWLVALVMIAGALLIFESDQLWKVQERNLFLCSMLYLKEQIVVPGGLLTWLGTWFTQFLQRREWQLGPPRPVQTGRAVYFLERM